MALEGRGGREGLGGVSYGLISRVFTYTSGVRLIPKKSHDSHGRAYLCIVTARSGGTNRIM